MKFLSTTYRFLLALLLFACPVLQAQEDTPEPAVIHVQKPGLHCDCGEAKIVVLRDSLQAHFSAENHGFGRQEFQPAKTNTGISTPEHHPVWYKLSIRKRGILSFRLRPGNPRDNYNFMLFKSSDDNSCMAILKGTLQALRGNRSDTLAPTGMAYLALNEFGELKKTKGDPFSKGLDVRPGEDYLLVIDNVESKDFEFDIRFRIDPILRYNVRIVNDKRQGIKASVGFQPRPGTHVARGYSDPARAIYGYVHQTADILYFIAGNSLQTGLYVPKVVYFDSLYPIAPDTVQLETLKAGTVYPIEPLVFKADHSLDASQCKELLSSYAQLSVSNPKLNMVLICNTAAGGDRRETEAVYKQILKGHGVVPRRIAWREEPIAGMGAKICVIFEKQKK